MFDRLDDLLIRYEELMEELGSPEVASDTNRFRKLMKEQSDLAPIVEAYKEYKKAKQDVEDSLALLDEESDEEMREMAKEELNTAKKRIEELEQELKILLLPKDPNDEKNVIVEIRAGAGGDEAALFASELYRMYGMRAAGDVRFSMILSCISMWAFRVTLCIYLCRVHGFGPIAVWIGMFTDWTIRGIVFTFRFMGRRWLAHKVV